MVTMSRRPPWWTVSCPACSRQWHMWAKPHRPRGGLETFFPIPTQSWVPVLWHLSQGGPCPLSKAQAPIQSGSSRGLPVTPNPLSIFQKPSELTKEKVSTQMDQAQPEKSCYQECREGPGVSAMIAGSLLGSAQRGCFRESGALQDKGGTELLPLCFLSPSCVLNIIPEMLLSPYKWQRPARAVGGCSSQLFPRLTEPASAHTTSETSASARVLTFQRSGLRVHRDHPQRCSVSTSMSSFFSPSPGAIDAPCSWYLCDTLEFSCYLFLPVQLLD